MKLKKTILIIPFFLNYVGTIGTFCILYSLLLCNIASSTAPSIQSSPPPATIIIQQQPSENPSKKIIIKNTVIGLTITFASYCAYRRYKDRKIIDTIITTTQENLLQTKHLSQLVTNEFEKTTTTLTSIFDYIKQQFSTLQTFITRLMQKQEELSAKQEEANNKLTTLSQQISKNQQTTATQLKKLEKISTGHATQLTKSFRQFSTDHDTMTKTINNIQQSVTDLSKIPGDIADIKTTINTIEPIIKQIACTLNVSENTKK